ncbi:MAG: hypothetical protein ACREP6_16160 [Candidatus Binataceae bacterium]
MARSLNVRSRGHHGDGERKARTFSLPWGAGIIEEEAQAADAYHRPTIQLLTFTEGEAAGNRQVRFCYYDQVGRFQRSPLIVDEANLSQLRAALKKTPKLRQMLRKLIN